MQRNGPNGPSRRNPAAKAMIFRDSGGGSCFLMAVCVAMHCNNGPIAIFSNYVIICAGDAAREEKP
jgi:hypothetical protein